MMCGSGRNWQASALGAEQWESEVRVPETFDAFYARTVSTVTSQMHALAVGDPQADDAIREAYARAYQQWFEVSGDRTGDLGARRG